LFGNLIKKIKTNKGLVLINMSDEKIEKPIDPTINEQYFSRSKNEWIPVSEMTDPHVRRAFNRILRMIRLGQLVPVEETQRDTFAQERIKNQVSSIRIHCDNIISEVTDEEKNS